MSTIATGMATATQSSAARSRHGARGRYARIALATVAAATLANLAVYYLADVFVRYDPDFVVLSTPGGTIVFTLVAAVVAVLVYGALLRFARNPVRAFRCGRLLQRPGRRPRPYASRRGHRDRGNADAPGGDEGPVAGRRRECRYPERQRTILA